MKVQGAVDPGVYSIENIPMSDNVLVRFYLNAVQLEDEYQNWEYEEYTSELPKTKTLRYEIENNINVFIEEAKKHDPELLAEQAKAEELAELQFRADIDYIAVMTGVEL